MAFPEHQPTFAKPPSEFYKYQDILKAYDQIPDIRLTPSALFAIGFSAQDINKLTPNLKLFDPTIFANETVRGIDPERTTALHVYACAFFNTLVRYPEPTATISRTYLSKLLGLPKPLVERLANGGPHDWYTEVRTGKLARTLALPTPDLNNRVPPPLMLARALQDEAKRRILERHKQYPNTHIDYVFALRKPVFPKQEEPIPEVPTVTRRSFRTMNFTPVALAAFTGDSAKIHAALNQVLSQTAEVPIDQSMDPKFLNHGSDWDVLDQVPELKRRRLISESKPPENRNDQFIQTLGALKEIIILEMERTFIGQADMSDKVLRGAILWLIYDETYISQYSHHPELMNYIGELLLYLAKRRKSAALRGEEDLYERALGGFGILEHNYRTDFNTNNARSNLPYRQ